MPVWPHYACTPLGHTFRLCNDIRTIFFLLGVWFPRSKKRISEIIPGGFGNTWSYDFYIGMQNGSKLIEQIFDSCL